MYEQTPFSNYGISNLSFNVNGWFKDIASSLLPEIDSSIKMHKYMRFDF